MLCVVPGPDMVFLLAQTLSRGKRNGMLVAFGINAGAYVHLTGAVLGLSAILAASSLAFIMIKWVGVAYLIYLGITCLLRENKNQVMTNQDRRSTGNAFWQGFFCDLLNPKVALFYLAFLPQFIDTDNQHVTAQLLLLGITLNVIGLVINWVLVLLAASASSTLRANPRTATLLHKLLGTVLITLGLRLAAEKSP